MKPLDAWASVVPLPLADTWNPLTSMELNFFFFQCQYSMLSMTRTENLLCFCICLLWFWEFKSLQTLVLKRWETQQLFAIECQHLCICIRVLFFINIHLYHAFTTGPLSHSFYTNRDQWMSSYLVFLLFLLVNMWPTCGVHIQSLHWIQNY